MMGFGEALVLVRRRVESGENSGRFRRRGWQQNTHIVYHTLHGKQLGFFPCFLLKDVDNIYSLFTPSHADLFAEDWVEVA